MSDSNFNLDFLAIPTEYILNPDLKWVEKALLSEVLFFSKNGQCFASNEYFAQFLNLTADRVKHIIPDLVKRGYLNSETKYNTEKRKKERILTLTDQSAISNTTHSAIFNTDQSAKNDTIIYKEEYNNIEYNSNNNSSNLIFVDNNKNLSMNTSIHNTSVVSTTDAPENHIEEVYFSQTGQIEISLSKAYEDINLKRDTTSQEKITDFFLYFVERYTEHTGHKPYPIKYDKLITFVKRLVDSKLINGGRDSILNYDTDEIEWMIDDYFDYDFDDCNYSIHHFMSKKILSTRFRRLQNKYQKTA